MSDVFLTHSYFYKLDPKQWRFRQPYPPIGTLLAASIIRNLNLTLHFEDANLQESARPVCDAILSSQARYVIIYDDGFNYLTKMCLSVMREAAFEMIRAAKSAGQMVIVCNSDSTDQYEKYLTEGADYVIRGEGEETLKELLICLEQGGNIALINGLAYRQGTQLVTSPPRPVLRNLDTLPLPAWELADIESYRKVWLAHHGYFSLNVATTRGCPFKCNWCAKPIYGNRYHSRSPQHVIREIELLISKYQVDYFWMCDDIFGLTPGWVSDFANLVRQKNLKFRYKIQSRVDLLLEADAIRSLAQSGADSIWVGAESGSQRILDAMDKGTRVSQIKEATSLLKQHKIKVGYFLQFGYPGETQEDIDATVNLVLDQMPDEIGISISYPLPGTKFYDRVKGELKQKQNWTDSDDLALLFRNTYPADYYKLLHRYVHNRYRVRRGILIVRKWFQPPLQFQIHEWRKILSMVYHWPIAIVQGIRLKQLMNTTHA